MHIPTTALELHRQLVALEVVTSCLSCDFFDEEAELCNMAHQRPPARVLVLGCGQWSPRIPF